MHLDIWSYVQRHTVMKILIAVIISAVLYAISSFLFPILLAIGLAFALYPMTKALTHLQLGKSGTHPSSLMAIVLAFLVFAAIAGVIVSYIVLPLFGQLNALIVRLPEYSTQVDGDSLFRLIKDPAANPGSLPSSIEGLLEDTLAWIMGFVSTMVRNLLHSTMEIMASLFGLIVVPFLAFYFLKDWKQLCDMIESMGDPSAKPKVHKVLVRIGSAISSYVSGLWKLSLLSGISVTVVLAVLGIPYPMVFGFIAMMAETIPILGPLVASVPAVFVAYTSVSPHVALMAVIFYACYYTLDGQVFVPVIMGRKINLHPVVIILALMIGGRLFGILGMLFAVPVAAVYRVLYDELWHYDGSDKSGEKSNGTSSEKSKEKSKEKAVK